MSHREKFFFGGGFKPQNLPSYQVRSCHILFWKLVRGRRTLLACKSSTRGFSAVPCVLLQNPSIQERKLERARPLSGRHPDKKDPFVSFLCSFLFLFCSLSCKRPSPWYSQTKLHTSSFACSAFFFLEALSSKQHLGTRITSGTACGKGNLLP